MNYPTQLVWEVYGRLFSSYHCLVQYRGYQAPRRVPAFLRQLGFDMFKRSVEDSALDVAIEM